MMERGRACHEKIPLVIPSICRGIVGEEELWHGSGGHEGCSHLPRRK